MVDSAQVVADQIAKSRDVCRNLLHITTNSLSIFRGSLPKADAPTRGEQLLADAGLVQQKGGTGATHLEGRCGRTDARHALQENIGSWVPRVAQQLTMVQASLERQRRPLGFALVRRMGSMSEAMH